ncbi:hypothetical protein B0H19DRAFT_1109613 [Mycena capillaripes]|nr:hypothetical protein B0H19DRAFT_1185541 [Mycena capillaripes]KAJ6581558.1 hypothetical protein B0H19DRAFT_1115835 [Mycena capillaripes]KAJ6585417.1 hypothetical protein B0H19DRAFT_1109613 [Mycena capillaripes]
MAAPNKPNSRVSSFLLLVPSICLIPRCCRSKAILDLSTCTGRPAPKHSLYLLIYSV